MGVYPAVSQDPKKGRMAGPEKGQSGTTWTNFQLGLLSSGDPDIHTYISETIEVGQQICSGLLHEQFVLLVTVKAQPTYV